MTGLTELTVNSTPGAVLADHPVGRLHADRGLWGFGGLHGGLVLARLAQAMGAAAPTGLLRSATARFHRPVRDEWSIETSVTRIGRTATTAVARAVTDRGTNVDASAVFTTPGGARWETVSPAMPAAAPPESLDVFTIPPEIVPFASHVEIRPATDALPYSGAPEPELVAWIRFVEDDRPPDLPRLITLLDALAPSYLATVTDLTLAPTVELTVTPADGLGTASSPWVLLRATTRSASSSGWIDEVIDAWGPDGHHLGSAHQLRVAVAG
jgi:acyl-coenzyme A thioesterase PaaI-like protein